MEKIFSMLLVAVLVLSLCACGAAAPGESSAAPTETASSPTFMAGYGKVDITPQESGVPMSGYASSSERLSTGLASYLYAIAVAVQDEDGNIAVMVSLDHGGLSILHTDNLRQWAEKKLGIPKENVLIASIHQHSTPDPDNKAFPSSMRYQEYMLKGIKEAITTAVEDLSPAEVYIATATTEALSFVRHYWAKDGTLCGDGFGSFASGLVSHESESDKEMRLVKFAREVGNDIVMVNFQGHPHMGTSGLQTDVHSDWPGVMRDAVTERLGVDCIYFSGAGGNLNSTSRITSENITTDFRDHGKRAAEYVVNAEDGYTKVNTGTIRCKEITIAYEADHSMDHLLNNALIVHEARLRNSEEARALLNTYTEFHSIYHASAVVAKAQEGPTRDITISAITFGDVAVTVHPYEMFDTNGMELRGGSVGNENYDAEDQLENPFKMTVISTIGNGSNGYIPSRMGYTNGGYSTDITKYGPGTGEQLVGDYLRLLNELHD